MHQSFSSSLNFIRVPPLVPTLKVKDDRFDSVVVVTDGVEKLTGDLECLKEPLEDYSKVIYHAFPKF